MPTDEPEDQDVRQEPAEPTGGGISRRQVLQAGVAAGAIGAVGGVPRRASARKPQRPCGDLADIEHVIFCNLENRSFDHLFGTFPGVRGFDDHSVRQRDGSSVYRQKTTGIPGLPPVVLPFHINTEIDLGPPVRPGQCIQNTGADEGNQWGIYHNNYRAEDKWVIGEYPIVPAASAPQVMGYYERSDLPFLYTLAQEFTICDNFYSSVIGGTDANRLMAISGTIDPDGWDGGAQFLNTIDPPRKPTLFNLGAQGKWVTYPQVLEERGISWKIYQSDNLYIQNPLRLFNNPNGYADPSSPLYQKGIALSPGTFHLDEFEADCRKGTLPSVSWICPNLSVSQHPPFPMQWGEVFLHNIIDALTGNPQLWAKTALFISYDEGGGYFDHVPPPTPRRPEDLPGEVIPPGTIDPADPAYAETYDGRLLGPIGLSYRVPMIIVSPFTRGGLICSDRFDHTSTLRFCETRFGAPVPNRDPRTKSPGLSKWRRRIVGNLTSAFNFAARPDTSVPPLPATPEFTEEVYTQCIIVPLEDHLPGFGDPPANGAYPLPQPQRPAVQEPQRGPIKRPSGIC